MSYSLFILVFVKRCKGLYILDGSFFSHFKNKKCIGGAQKELFKRILKIEFGHILKEY